MTAHGYVTARAYAGLRSAVLDVPGFAAGVSVVDDHVTHPAVALAHACECVDVLDVV